MKYIITESQYNVLLESNKKINLFQELIDSNMKYIRRVCDKGAEDYRGDVGHESCEQIEDVEKIDVTSVDWYWVKHSNREEEEKMMSIKLMVYYRSINQHGDFNADDLVYDLEQMLRKSTGMKIIVNYHTTNLNKNFNW